MRTIIPPLPVEHRRFLKGWIVESDDAMDLSEDMAEVSLPNGVLVHAGWQIGEYKITVMKGLKYLVRPVTTDSADVAASDFAELVARFAGFPYVDGVSEAETTYFGLIREAVA